MDRKNSTGPPLPERVILEPAWSEYDLLIGRLIDAVEAEYCPDRVIGIMSGGMVPAIMVAKYFKVQLAAMAVQSYEAGSSGLCDRRGKVRFGRELASVDYDFSGRILLVDDLTDSGITMEYSADWLRSRYGEAVGELRTAVIWHKTCSTWLPDFYAAKVEPDGRGNYPWIIQPFEKYEKNRV